MGEDLSKIEYASKDETVVFWNLEDYPIPRGANLGVIYPNIELALHKMGFHGPLSIMAFGKNLYHDVDALSMANIAYDPEVSPGDDSCVWRMIGEIVSFLAVSFPMNYMVIAKQHPELYRVLHSMKSRNQIVLLLQPPGDTAQQDTLFPSVESVVDCTKVFGGGKPIHASNAYPFYCFLCG
ncbi:unnamed protein product [Arabidopsis lyrata]|uniref:uncharacterized protein LOC110227171 n=1 Tax=Arabidopsis lyrata subsp. lyrata TaxID=81972 RepID=UPI000A29B4E3|nr:uncharacterized protein LOC110227171 [Arabidopsis lyrata subsp. lyrata]XP_020884413.1 uncharacterized protein LOC110229200 [Arabidopsis lyrata subsp. lyrata]CAH8263702.1 unnamed protein product [Arabidopsis lyrata]|eukprot:XP_020876229.1 uncharacterized protein LOC110227171 [Arabidopsis lyrata subsp. lyrata]